MTKHPTFDADGYPTEETLRTIEAWDYEYIPGWLAYVREAWDTNYGRACIANGFLKLATGGWRGNEVIVQAMRKNFILWTLTWESSHRGGLEVLRIPNLPAA